MRSSVVDGLKRLQEVVYRLYRILLGELPNQVGSFNPEDGVQSERQVEFEEPTSEINELSLAIHSAVSHLFSLSMLIRRQRPKGRLLNFQNFVPTEQSTDITYIRDKFPKLVTSPWLTQRLGNYISSRREAIRYRQLHRQQMGAPTGPDIVTDNITEIAATTFVESTNGGHGPNRDLTAPRGDLSVFTSATSFMSSRTSIDGWGPRIPDLSEMILDGVPLQYTEPFECPYCRTIQNVANRLEWKHVFSDLQPYICTFEQCPSPVFGSRHEWFQHEMDNHRRQWSCILCRDSAKIFLHKNDMENHLRSSHAESVTTAQLGWLLEACDRPLLKSATLYCVFCDQWDPNTQASQNATIYGRHVAQHLQTISLASIPLSIEGLEIVNCKFENQNNDDSDLGSNVNLEPHKSRRVSTGSADNISRRSEDWMQGDENESMGSSFGDLDDASVTQSALEEALMINHQRSGPTRTPSPEPIVRHDPPPTPERERPAEDLEYRSRRRNSSPESAYLLDLPSDGSWDK
ncbi:hypothetical protein F5Y14DRAFT_321282 [Nemania sp. NC0429]|nr:hypothetical protein F5Y14DRAFT_321282 [Nemania sp. NC0429]